MDTHFNYHAPKVVSLDELAERRDEFEVPNGAIEAFKAGSAPVIVFMRSTGEEYQLAETGDRHEPLTTLGPTPAESREPDAQGPAPNERA